MSNLKSTKRQDAGEMKAKALEIGWIFAKELNFDIRQLSTGWNQEKAREYLQSSWKIKDKSFALNLLHYLENEGERAAYNIILPSFLDAGSKEERRKLLEEHYIAIARLIEYSDNLSDSLPFLKVNTIFPFDKEDFKRGTTAWDMALLITITRISYDARYIDEPEAWLHIENAYKHCLKTFKNENEIKKSLLLGEAMRSGNTDKFFRIFGYLKDVINL